MLEPDKLSELCCSGLVQRWHSHPTLSGCGETNGHHQWLVAVLVMHALPTRLVSARLIRAGLFHDVGEHVTGDHPSRAAFPEHSAVLADLVDEAREIQLLVQERLGCAHFNSLSRDEELGLHLCDRLAAYITMLVHQPILASGAKWVAAFDRMVESGWRLGVDVPSIVNSFSLRLRD